MPPLASDLNASGGAPSRRDVLRLLGLGALAAPLAGTGVAAAQTAHETTRRLPLVKPPRLRYGDTVGLVCPASRLDGPGVLEEAQEVVEALGFRAKVGRYCLTRHGYLAGTDADRAADLMEMFTDRDVHAVLALRGGWGCARLLPLLDFDAIRANPKPLIGYSDITALLLAIYQKSGLVTFHGPVGRSTWTTATIESFRDVLVHGRTPAFGEDAPDGEGADEGEASGPFERRRDFLPVRAGVAEGPLVGGNLSVLAGLVGTPYLPSFAGHVLFVEEVAESLYRIDRMLTQLRLAGAFDEMAALVFGQCRRCTDDGDVPGDGLRWLLRDQLQGLRVAAWTGAPIGHVSPVYTLPVGTRVVTDAALGTLAMLEPAVD
ncbi:MAG TPA: LD-carboxypeptidase [Rubricoccaceae bacterium]|nr:LD-carboxypeptidase [Rubricoccaceae bacterium]